MEKILIEVCQDDYGRKALYFDNWRVSTRQTKPVGVCTTIEAFEIERDAILHALDITA